MPRIPTPYKHPKTGVYWVRRHVPEHLKKKLGVSLYQRTLDTKDVGEAKVRFADALAELNERWARLCVEPGRLTMRQSKAIAGEYRRWSIARSEGDPGKPEDLRTRIAWERNRIRPSGGRPPGLGPVFDGKFDEFLVDRGIVVHPDDLVRLLFDCAHAEVSAKETLLRYAEGDFGKAPDEDLYPEYVPTQPKGASAGSKGRGEGPWLTVADHWDAFVAEEQHALGTQKSYKQKLLAFEKFLGQPNFAVATPEMIGDWKRQLMNDGLSRKTIREGYITALRGFYQWAVEDGRTTTNPSAEIKVRKAKVIQSDPNESDKDLSDEHADLILSESLRPSHQKASPFFAKAKRWIPWILAYTGARVNEVTQVRRKDFTCEKIRQGDAWMMRITPDAGTVKGGKARDVVLHPHLIEQGLIDFVMEQADGPLFYDPVRSRGGSKLNPPQRKLGDNLAAWVRELGVDDPNVSPNHAWRHRFKTTARRDDVMMDREVREGMAGHATATVGEAYGKIPTGRKWVEVCKLPRYEVLPPTGDPPESEAKRLRNAKRVATAERAKVRRLAATRSRAAVSSLNAACDGSVLDCDIDPAADRHKDHMTESATV